MARYKKKQIELDIAPEGKKYKVIASFTADIGDRYIKGEKEQVLTLSDNDAEVLLNAQKIEVM